MKKYSKKTMKVIMKYHRDEETASAIYKAVAVRLKNEKDKETLLTISAQEKAHAAIWKRYTGKNFGPNKIKIIWYIFVSYILGYTFIMKRLERGEIASIEHYLATGSEIAEMAAIVKMEKSHEKKLSAILDEERLKYSGAMALGVNNAIVELTGALAGFTLAFSNTRIIAMTGIITVITVMLSMTAAHYLTEHSEENPHAFKSSIYTGMTYLITACFLLLPYFLYPQNMYLAALITTLVIAIFVIFFFTYYITTAKSQKFFRHFIRMAWVSIGIAAAAFTIGLLARHLFGIAA